MSIIPEKPRVIAVLGPTASGKSALAVALSKKFNGEVVSADSRQVYRGMNIGTGKVPRDKSPRPATCHLPPTTYFSSGIPHHLLDVASPKRTFTVVDYQKHAQAAIKKISAKHKIPIICGGTGLYIDAALYNYALPEVKANPALRRKLGKELPETLFIKLKKLDPLRAKSIDRWNKRRLIRALEIIEATGKPVPPRDSVISRNALYDVLKIGIKLPDNELKVRIGKRLRERFSQGMVTEVKKLHKQGMSWKRLESFGLEYRFVARYLQNKLKKDEMVRELERAIWHYAKRQMTWFKRDKDIFLTSGGKHVEAEVKKFLR